MFDCLFVLKSPFGIFFNNTTNDIALFNVFLFLFWQADLYISEVQIELLFYILWSVNKFFTIIAEILTYLLANFYCQYADRHKFIIYTMCQQVRADNLTICYCKKTNWWQFCLHLSCYWLWMLSQHCHSSLLIHSAIASWIHSEVKCQSFLWGVNQFFLQ